MIPKALHGNDSLKLEMIYEHYALYIYRVALKKLGNEELAKDCTQLAYEKIIRYIDKIDVIDSKETQSYIYRIVKSVAIDMQRKEKKNIPCEEGILLSLLESSRSQEELNRMMIEACQGDFLDDTLRLINEKERNLLIMKFSQDMSYEEMGEMLGISEMACRKRIQRIREKVANRMENKEATKMQRKGEGRWKRKS